jgi:Tat protein secretion system quality control protein TatD with DNase activity
MFVDSHCHLSFPELSSQLPEIRAAMAQAQVDRALCICTTLEEFEDVHALAMGYDNFWASVGVHPDNEGVTEPVVDNLLQLRRPPAWWRSAKPAWTTTRWTSARAAARGRHGVAARALPHATSARPANAASR